MGLWVKIRDRLLDLAGKYLASLLEDDKPSVDAPAAPADPAPTPAQETPQEAADGASGAPAADGAVEPTAAPLEACVRASCWNGANAETRYSATRSSPSTFHGRLPRDATMFTFCS